MHVRAVDLRVTAAASAAQLYYTSLLAFDTWKGHMCIHTTTKTGI